MLQVAAKVSSSTDMDADFLKRTIGKPLSEALASLVIAQPPDPIEFIGEALLDYIKRRDTETQVRKKIRNQGDRAYQASTKNSAADVVVLLT